MCGIFGYFHRHGDSLAAETLDAMGQAIRHRGPDDRGMHTGAGFAVGNQRLSIIDIAGGHQPFLSDDGKIAVVQNGEIFNHIELAQELARSGYPCRTHSDTEVLLRLYEREGIGFLSRLNGMFAIAIHDAREGALYLARDRIGVKPLYLHDDGERLVFASEIKALLAAGVPRRVDYEALHYFLTFNYVPPPYTAFADVRHLMPGNWLRIDRNGETTTQRWWDLSEMQSVNKPEAQWIEEFNTILDDAVRLRLRADVPFGAFLSGGVDSSSVVGLMARHMTRPVKTFCIGFDDPRYDESLYAQETAQRFHTEHTLERVAPNMLDLWPLATYHCDQPHGDVSFLPTYRVAELAARQVKMVLTGDGGDELFAGYDKYRNFFTPAVQTMDEPAFRQAWHRNLSLFSDAAKAALYTPEFVKRVEGCNPARITQALHDQVPHFDRLNQALFIDMQLLLPGNNLVKPDRMGMAVSLEARTPFLDYRMMEFAFTMPAEYKLRDGVTKYLFKKAVVPLIGENLAYRKKQMFTVPIGDWLRTELAEYSADLLLGEQASSRGLFRREHLAGMLADHVAGAANYTRELRACMAVELWFRAFFDEGADNRLGSVYVRPSTGDAAKSENRQPHGEGA